MYVIGTQKMCKAVGIKFVKPKPFQFQRLIASYWAFSCLGVDSLQYTKMEGEGLVH